MITFEVWKFHLTVIFKANNLWTIGNEHKQFESLAKAENTKVHST